MKHDCERWGHCWHKSARDRTTSTCCHCGARRSEKMEFARPDGHGPFAPLVPRTRVVVVPAAADA